ncbi:hypothetical protein A3B21_01410 [Candidatus Uhrbacteria bacterium RIFCSPLOWO2_01_FULL_47_24]|uniref:Peptidase M56 domain-containing protein n=1 Tax=Candidatus Uhrbacteria bacterium RIFCSPLOWO2_01_FULL_47_24 TaxID=1802401 RepID=A0A1F7UNW3_9BACT|nr:MAG: hypothetical protein A3D58_02785 [Candidatus Uhrbacteria bacterium RIFCSPHIGHO2_02_FULL_46_47]OGL76709.1 MAG: hypothetical protein A3F52_00410 [Candidatus Uhrbacteria bacterium RIFCSPHIGHO2_12_FULL_47_11]OGL79935.1 MAG: hypothetical protein A3B21_01410 [Candidatus Uhrbacteria bacterium RIFCSPLOWO2_01_FULL_47_24]OGL84192.1 MAG: hypothetical protein A3J03_02005 [Candidatus Uhrbacteria bacterium RIFCSPLOWO2_02_FULL_46_25]OGL93342.1 MAG: hypothetical protein A3H11_02470 [Candidatus Uhrbacte
MNLKATRRKITVAIAGVVLTLMTLEIFVFKSAWGMFNSFKTACDCASGGFHTWTQWLIAGLGTLFVSGFVVAVIYAVRTFFRTRQFISRVVGEAKPIQGVVQFERGSCEAFTFGYIKPTVAICAHCARTLPAQELNAMLAHEAHHAKHKDPLWFFIFDTLRYAFFFIPLMRTLALWYRTLAELYADEGVDRLALGGALLRLAEAKKITPRASSLAVSSFASVLSFRIERLLNPDFKMRLQMSATHLLVTMFMVFGVLSALTHFSNEPLAASGCRWKMPQCAQLSPIDGAPPSYYTGT